MGGGARGQSGMDWGGHIFVDGFGRLPCGEVQALSTYVVVMAPNPCRVLVSRESAADDRQGFCLTGKSSA